MNKQEKEKIRKIVTELLKDEEEGQDYTWAIGTLCRMIGLRYAPYELIQKEEIKAISLYEISKRNKSTDQGD